MLQLLEVLHLQGPDLLFLGSFLNVSKKKVGDTNMGYYLDIFGQNLSQTSIMFNIIDVQI